MLIISQSGQTFPSLKSTARMVQFLHDRVFVLVGSIEESAENTEMGSIIMEHHQSTMKRDGSDHIFCNLSGLRLSEPSSVTVAATHHTLTELLAFTHQHLAGSDQERKSFAEAMTGLTGPCITNLESIVGCDVSGRLTDGGQEGENARRSWFGSVKKYGRRDEADQGEYVHQELIAAGKRWGRHISEPWRLMVLTGNHSFFDSAGSFLQ